jgi:hypothetical protein
MKCSQNASKLRRYFLAPLLSVMDSRLEICKACKVIIKCIYFARCFLSKRKNVNYTFVFIQYMRKDEKNFAIQFVENEKKKDEKSFCAFASVCARACVRERARVFLRACVYHSVSRKDFKFRSSNIFPQSN